MLIPREHGAYGQLLFPLLTALLIGHPAAGAYMLAAAAVALFLAHEALLVVLGQRGGRARRERGADARRTLALFGAFFAVTGGVSLLVITRAALWSLLLPVLLGLVVFAVIVAHKERSTAGEALVGLALASLSVPVALAGAVPRVAALTLFVVFAGVFVTATIAVRSMIGRSANGGPSSALAGALAIALLAGLAASAVTGRLSPVAPYAAMPVCAIALGLAARPPSARYLRAIGWTLVGATALTAAVLVSALA